MDLEYVILYSVQVKRDLLTSFSGFKGLGGFQRLKTGTFLLFFYISNEIFYSNALPYKRYIFDKYFVKYLLKIFENSVIGTSSPVTLQKKSSLGVVRITHDRFIWNLKTKIFLLVDAYSSCLNEGKKIN